MFLYSRRNFSDKVTTMASPSKGKRSVRSQSPWQLRESTPQISESDEETPDEDPQSLSGSLILPSLLTQQTFPLYQSMTPPPERLLTPSPNPFKPKELASIWLKRPSSPPPNTQPLQRIIPTETLLDTSPSLTTPTITINKMTSATPATASKLKLNKPPEFDGSYKQYRTWV